MALYAHLYCALSRNLFNTTVLNITPTCPFFFDRSSFLSFFFFFFQAEDGIRDLTVTGVQTCALPISRVEADEHEPQLATFLVGHAAPDDAMTAGALGAPAEGRARVGAAHVRTD